MSAAHLPGYVAIVRFMITWLDGRTLHTDLVWIGGHRSRVRAGLTGPPRQLHPYGLLERPKLARHAVVG